MPMPKRTKKPPPEASAAAPAPAPEQGTPLYLRLNKEERARFEAAHGRTRLRYLSDWAREALWQASKPPK